MWLVIRRRTLLWRGVCVWLLLGLTLTALAYFRSPPAAEASGLSRPETVYVIDPGHGGEDGGAVAADGTVESGVNLGHRPAAPGYPALLRAGLRHDTGGGCLHLFPRL